jgi:hypothetical protein
MDAKLGLLSLDSIRFCTTAYAVVEVAIVMSRQYMPKGSSA